MSSRNEPLRKKEREELEGYVGWVPVVSRAVLFVILLGGAGLLLRAVFAGLSVSKPSLSSPLFWIVPTALVGLAVAIRARRWTGGRDLREKIARDLERGQAAVHTLHALEAIVIEEVEDEGPTIYVQTELSGVVRFCGQYLDRQMAKGFPWHEITIREAPESHIFFGVWGNEDGEIPVIRRGPLTSMEAARLGPFDEEYVRLRMDFETLKGVLGLRGAEADRGG